MGELFTLHRKDARKLSEDVPSNTVDVTITSPPYYDLKDYEFDEQIGYGQDYQKEYLRDLQSVFGAIFRATNRTGSLWVVVDSFSRSGKLVPLPFDMAQRAEAEGWQLTNTLIWNKTRTLPWTGKGQLRSVFEHILFFTKSKQYKFYVNRIREPAELKQWWVKYPERYNPRGKVPTDIWTFPIPTQGSWGNGFLRHFCPFPADLVERVIQLTTDLGDVVMDPFAGSGVVLAQAFWMQRRYIGFELKEQYCSMFETNVLPAIGKEWKAREKVRQKREEARTRLEEAIRKLRQLKFAVALAKQIAVESECQLDELDINTLFAVSHGLGRQSPRSGSNVLRETVVLVLNDGSRSNRHTTDVAEVALGRIPQWKYTVQAEAHVVTWRDFLESERFDQLLRDERIWLYPASRFNWYDSELTFRDWKKRSSTPDWPGKNLARPFPLAANIQIRQDVTEFRETEGYQANLDRVGA